jgi:dynein light intermediate chain 1, cytosolic
VIDRDKIVVPANWDSWGKIRIIREGFDIEGVGNAWSAEIQESPKPLENGLPENGPPDTTHVDNGSSAVATYEQTIQDPRQGLSLRNDGQSDGTKIGIETEDMQTFLGKQSEILGQLRLEDEKDRVARRNPRQLQMSPNLDEGGQVNEHIGPVQFNMGGIQVDADDMLRKIKVRLRALAVSSVFGLSNSD